MKEVRWRFAPYLLIFRYTYLKGLQIKEFDTLYHCYEFINENKAKLYEYRVSKQLEYQSFRY